MKNINLSFNKTHRQCKLNIRSKTSAGKLGSLSTARASLRHQTRRSIRAEGNGLLAQLANGSRRGNTHTHIHRHTRVRGWVMKCDVDAIVAIRRKASETRAPDVHPHVRRARTALCPTYTSENLETIGRCCKASLVYT